jgi:hypothetical protein
MPILGTVASFGLSPEAPTIGTATAGDASATVTYTAPTWSGKTSGSVTYTATSSPGGFTGTGSSPITVSGLTNGTAYTFTVTATTSYGVTGPASAASNSVAPALPNSYEAIATLSGTGSATIITFSSIPSTYKHLQIRGVNVTDYNSTDYGNAGIRFNGDSGLNYTTHAMRGYWDGGTGNKQGLNYTLGSLNYGMISVAYLNTNNDVVFPTIVDILNYANTNNRKVAKAWSGSTYSTDKGILQTGSTFWDSDSAINSISLLCANGSWTSKTKFTLYGIKDS